MASIKKLKTIEAIWIAIIVCVLICIGYVSISTVLASGHYTLPKEPIPCSPTELDTLK